MTTLPRPTKETYIDFLKRKLKGRNISPEFMARNPAYFDLRGEDSPTTPATWETFYRRAKPKTSVDSGRDEGMFSPDPPNNIPYTKDGIFHAPDGSIHVDMPKAYRDYYLAQADRTITNAPREFERAVNEFTTGFPDLRSQDSIAKQQGYNLDEGLMQLPADLVPGYHNTGMSLQQELMPFTGLLSDPGIHGFTSETRSVGPRGIGDPIYESEINRYTPAALDFWSFDPDVDVRGEAGIPTLSNQAFGVSKWSPYESRAAAETRKADEEKYGEPGLFPNLEGPIGNFIRDEIWSPVERGVGEVTDFIKSPVNYVEKWAKNLDYKDAISTGVGIAVNQLAPISGGIGLFGIPGALASVVVQGMMSEGGGQIGMPGQVEHSIPITHADGTKGWSTTYTPDVISHFNSDGIAVNVNGDPVLTPGPIHSPTSGHYQYGTPTKIDNTGTPESDDNEGGHQAGDDWGLEDESGMAMP